MEIPFENLWIYKICSSYKKIFKYCSRFMGNPPEGFKSAGCDFENTDNTPVTTYLIFPYKHNSMMP